MKKAYYSDYLWFDGEMCERQWLLIDNDKIVGKADRQPENGFEIVRYENSAIFPTFINTHTHAAMSLLRGYADDLPLHVWLNKYIWPAEKAFVSAQFIEDALMLSAAELIRSGVSCINDMYFFSELEAEILTKIGLRGVIGYTMMGNSDENLKKAKKLVDIVRSNNLINISICPHAPYTSTPEIYKKAVKFCQNNDVMLHTHLAETAEEIDIVKSKYGKRPALLMNEVGAFDCKSIFAHCVHLSDDEISLLGKKKVNISHCIQSNFKLASGFSPVKKLLDAGANVTIGTDGASSNNDQDMLSEIQTVALFHKAFNNDSTIFDARTAFVAATENAARALYLDNIGILKENYMADFMVVSYESAHMQPVYNPFSSLIYSAHKNDITDVFVAGKQLLQNRILTTINEAAVLNTTKKWTKKILNKG